METLHSPKQQYAVRSGTINVGREYETAITALMALRCSGNDTEDMWIAFNADGCGDFDDVVINRKIPGEDTSTTYLIQLKHKDKPNAISRREFLSNKPKADYYVKKYEQSYKEITTLAKNGSGIFNNMSGIENMQFIIFTNRSISAECEFLEKLENFKAPCLNTNNGNMYQFNDKNNVLESDPAFLNNFFLFSDQVSFSNVNDMIIDAIGQLVLPFKLNKEYLNDVVQEFVLFVDNWSKGEAVGHYLLNKSHVAYKITEILLNKFGRSVYEMPFVNNDKFNTNVWQKIVQNKNLIVVETSNKIMPSLSQYIQDRIMESLGLTFSIKTWLTLVPNKVIKKFLKQYETLSNPKSITVLDVYKVLWRYGELPIILEIKNKKEYDEIIHIHKISQYRLKIIILYTPMDKLSFNVPKELKNLQLFGMLDLATDAKELILNQIVKFQGKPTKLENIVKLNTNVMKNLLTHDIINILSDSFFIGNLFRNLTEFYIEQSVPRTFLDPNILTYIESYVLCISCRSRKMFSKYVQNINIYVDESVVFEYSTINNKKLPENCAIILDYSDDIKYNLKNFTDKPVHYIKLHIEKQLEWITSNGDIKTIKSYRLDEKLNTFKSISIYDVPTRFKNQINIISAGPGMGKSTLMNFLALNSPRDVWTLLINLNEFIDYFESDDFENFHKTPSKHLEYFYNSKLDKRDCAKLPSDVIFQHLLKNKRVVVLLDGFDEITPDYKEQVTVMTKLLIKEGYKVWLTTRSTLRAYLEDEFDTIAKTLNPFTNDDQVLFLTKFFTRNMQHESETNDDRVKVFVNLLLELTAKNLNDWDYIFTGVPLQTRLLAEVFDDDCKKYIETETLTLNQSFDLLYLYEKFTDSKIRILESKIGKYAKNLYGSFFAEYQNLNALKIIFKKDDVKDLNIDARLEIFTEMVNNAIQLVQQDGIVIANDEVNINFVHRTFAEYLSAKWLVQNYNSKYKDTAIILIKKIFNVNYTIVRNIFDRILAKNCVLHLAVINQQKTKALELIDSDSTLLSSLDKGGRTVLHLATAWSLRHRMPEKDEVIVPYEYEVKTEDDILKEIIIIILRYTEDLLKDEILNYTALDYAIESNTLGTANMITEKFNTPIRSNQIIPYLYYCSRFGYKSLFECIVEGNGKNEFQPYLNTNIDSYGFKALTWAVKENQLEMVQLLLFCGADINIKDESGIPLLHFVIDENSLDMLTLLINNGIDINATNDTQMTALYTAALEGKTNVVKILLMHEPDLTIPDGQGITPFEAAAGKGNADIVALFLHYFPEYAIKNKFKLTPLHIATINGKTDTVAKILSNVEDIDVVDALFEWTALHWAANTGLADIVKLLISKGADFDKRDMHSCTPLLWAAIKGKSEVVSLLLKKGANAEIPDLEGNTPLYRAVYAGQTTCVSLLLTHGANPNVTDKDEWTPLMWAASMGNVEICTLLLSHGADINTVETWQGNTALHWAVSNTEIDVLALLISKGANLNAVDKNGLTPLNDAVSNNKYDMAILLLEHGADINIKDQFTGRDTLCWAVIGGNIAVIKRLIAMKANPNETDFDGRTSLHWAAVDGKFDIVRLLLSNGVDVNVKDVDGNTALHLAAANGHLSVVTVLVSVGASTNIQDNEGNTPLQCAQTATKDGINGAKEVEDFLLIRN